VSGELPVELVERDEVTVMFKRVADEQAAITLGWAEFEQAVGSLRGRKFYGAADEGAFQGGGEGEYRICVQLGDGDDPAARGLELGTLPGGRYARVRLVGEPPAVYRLIGPAFERLAERSDCDPSRPVIEFYRSRDVIDLLQPVA
jgi:GyrI-like small molecule binding domain